MNYSFTNVLKYIVYITPNVPVISLTNVPGVSVTNEPGVSPTNVPQ